MVVASSGAAAGTTNGSAEGLVLVKDIRGSDVDEPDVEATDNPVITSDVSAGRLAHAPSIVRPLVEAAFDTHAGHLKAFALAAVRDNAAADDLVQETFLRLIREVREHGPPDNIGGWLHRVCANLIISRGRRHSVAERMKPSLVDRDVGVSAEDHVVRSDESSRLRAGLAQLPSDARIALLMAAAGFSTIEIGEAIGRTANATSTYICRARIRLREILSGTGGTP
jgi:RNA polymerase sigma factor (sigma-70 family)